MDETRPPRDFTDHLIELAPGAISGVFQLVEWGLLVAAIKYGASVFPNKSTDHRVLAGIALAGEGLISAWLLCSLYGRLDDFGARFGEKQKRPLRLLVVMLAAIVAMVGAERLLIGTVVRALATKAAH